MPAKHLAWQLGVGWGRGVEPAQVCQQKQRPCLCSNSGVLKAAILLCVVGWRSRQSMYRSLHVIRGVDREISASELVTLLFPASLCTLVSVTGPRAPTAGASSTVILS